MHEQHREDAKQRRLTGSEPSYNPGVDVDSPRLKWFNQGGRKICVGDTALFRAGNALPFIGIIRKVITDKDDALKLRVNWLYRPGDIELVKGTSLDASPNEVFYSFHKDVISAASLLHPCKVAFLPNGVDLPPEVSSLICRRVYDTSRKCLYWLTDRDYADEHQGEVDRLLKKTKQEMQTAGQSEKPSPRVVSEIKPETVHAGQGKSKKRERTDQIFDFTKRERHSREEIMEPKRERIWRFEDFAFIAEKDGGILHPSLVDQLVQVMNQERMDGSKDATDVVPHRILLVGIVAAMDKEDCLSHFVRCGGLPVLDVWLQEAHKGSLADGHHKESDKTLEELLFILLRALERLPVDIDALRASNIGKSVNLLKSHRNLDLQKKARKLVETWKKRVNAEMNQLDEAKSGPNSNATWSSKHGVETLTIRSCFTGGSKAGSSAQPPINGSAAVGEATSFSAYKDLTETSGSKINALKAHASGISDAVAAVKEEKSCSSSQSWCSGSGKSVGSLKEEGKVSSAASLGNKTATALRSHSKGHYPTMTTATALQRDSVGRQKTSGVEKMGNSMLSDKKGNEAANHSTQRLIVRLPNPGRSPAHSTSGGCLMDGGGSNNKGSSPALIERPDSINASNKAPEIHSPATSGDIKCANATIKVGKPGGDHKEDVSKSCIDTVDDVDYKSTDIKHRSRSSHASKKQPETHVNIPKRGANLSAVTATLGSNNINMTGAFGETVEGGICLLASVAACEGSEAEKSLAESANGDGCHPHIIETTGDLATHVRVLEKRDGNVEAPEDGMPCGEQKVNDSVSQPDCKPHMSFVRKSDPAESSVVLSELRETNSSCKALSSSMHSKDKEQTGEVGMESDITHRKTPSTAEVTVRTQDGEIATEEVANDGGASPHEGDCRAPSGALASEAQADNCQVSTPSALDNIASLQEGSENGSKDLPSPMFLKASPSRTNAGDTGSEFYGEDALEVARQVAKEVEQEVQRYGCHEAHGTSLSSSDEKDSNLDGDESLRQKQSDINDAIIVDSSVKMLGEDAAAAEGSVDTGMEDGTLDSVVYSKKESSDAMFTSPKDDAIGRPVLEIAADSSNNVTNDIVKLEVDSQSFANASLKAVPMVETVSEKETFLPKARKQEAVERPIFDLNEGLALEESFHDRVTHSLGPLPSPAPISDWACTSGHSSSLAAPVAVVSAMKGSFIPPSNILRPKVELGWKGSAATSAFRPAEPRRMAETLQSGSDATGDQEGRQARVLDIDLNVPDDKVIEETNLTSFGEADAVSNGPAASRPELDLNRVDESDESLSLPQSNGRSPNIMARAMLDFDLNDGLGCEDAGAVEVSSHRKNFESSSLPIVLETRPTPDAVNVIPWYNSPSSIPAAMMIPAFPTHRPDLQYPVVAAAGPKSAFTASNSFSQFGGNMYQGMAPVSSVNVGYPSTTFQHAAYPLAGSFPFSSTTYGVNSASNAALNNALTFPTATPSPLLSAGGVVSPFGRPYLGGCTGDGLGGDSHFSWARPSLDLNADVIAELDSKDEGYVRPSFGQLQYQQVGALSGALKRKEPESGLDAFRSNFKQMAWRE